MSGLLIVGVFTFLMIWIIIAVLPIDDGEES